MIVALCLLAPTFLIMQINAIYQAWPNFLHILQALFFMPLLIQEIGRVANRLIFKDELLNKDLNERVISFYKINETDKTIRVKLLKKLETCEAAVKYTIVFFFISSFIPLLSTLVNFAFTGRFKLIAPVYLPLIKPDEIFGFVVHTVIYLILTAHCSISLGILDFMYTLYGYQSILIADIIKFKVKKFIELVKKPKIKVSKVKNLTNRKQAPSKPKTVAADNVIAESHDTVTRKIFVAIINDTDFYYDYIKILYKIMELPTFIVIATNSYALCLASFILLTSSRIIGIALVLILLFQVASPCIIATIIDLQNEKLLSVISDIPWYQLSLHQQKIYLQLIHKCQNGRKLKLTTLGTVNMELFQSVINGAYSFFMYMWNFVGL